MTSLAAWRLSPAWSWDVGGIVDSDIEGGGLLECTVVECVWLKLG